jgi:hypothetical protein
LMDFWRKQIIMRIPAECQPFAHHGLGEMWANPTASGDGLSKNKMNVVSFCFSELWNGPLLSINPSQFAFL